MFHNQGSWSAYDLSEAPGTISDPPDAKHARWVSLHVNPVMQRHAVTPLFPLVFAKLAHTIWHACWVKFQAKFGTQKQVVKEADVPLELGTSEQFRWQLYPIQKNPVLQLQVVRLTDPLVFEIAAQLIWHWVEVATQKNCVLQLHAVVPFDPFVLLIEVQLRTQLFPFQE